MKWGDVYGQERARLGWEINDYANGIEKDKRDS